jgi:cytidylate kinase
VFIDTGAMYRAVALYFMRNEIAFDNITAIEKAIQSIQLHFQESLYSTSYYLE